MWATDGVQGINIGNWAKIKLNRHIKEIKGHKVWEKNPGKLNECKRYEQPQQLVGAGENFGQVFIGLWMIADT